MQTFDAPWSTSLKLITSVTIAILGVVIYAGLSSDKVHSPLTLALMVWLPAALIVIPAFFAITGYAVRDGHLLISRPGWTTVIELTGLQSASAEPDAMRGSLRLFGNGGLYCFAGKFRNKAIGSYRAWVTDPAHSVVIRLADKTLVVSPEHPARFAERVNAQRQNLR